MTIQALVSDVALLLWGLQASTAGYGFSNMARLVSALLLSMAASLVHAEECADLAQRFAQIDFSKAAAMRANDRGDTHDTFDGKPLPMSPTDPASRR
jgi:hypothetical protein